MFSNGAHSWRDFTTDSLKLQPRSFLPVRICLAAPIKPIMSLALKERSLAALQQTDQTLPGIHPLFDIHRPLHDEGELRKRLLPFC